jgi:hypothetical protein
MSVTGLKAGAPTEKLNTPVLPPKSSTHRCSHRKAQHTGGQAAAIEVRLEVDAGETPAPHKTYSPAAAGLGAVLN